MSAATAPILASAASSSDVAKPGPVAPQHVAVGVGRVGHQRGVGHGRARAQKLDPVALRIRAAGRDGERAAARCRAEGERIEVDREGGGLAVAVDFRVEIEIVRQVLLQEGAVGAVAELRRQPRRPAALEVRLGDDRRHDPARCAVSVSSIWAICPGSSQLPSPAVLRPKASSACFRLLRSCAATKLVPLSAPTRGAGGAGGGGIVGRRRGRREGIGRSRARRCGARRGVERGRVVGHRAARREVQADIAGPEGRDLGAMVGDDAGEHVAGRRGVDVVGRQRMHVAKQELIPGRAAVGRHRHVQDVEEASLSAGIARHELPLRAVLGELVVVPVALRQRQGHEPVRARLRIAGRVEAEGDRRLLRRRQEA